MVSYDSITQEIFTALLNENISVIVSCTKLKIWDKDLHISDEIEAQDVYKGPLFLQFLKFKAICDKYNIKFPWKILSAKYGLINPTNKIKDYNVSFASPYNFIKNNYVKNYEITDMVKNIFVNDNKFKKTKLLLIWAGKEYVERIRHSIEMLQHEKCISSDLCMICPVYKIRIGDSLHIVKDINCGLEEKFKCKNVS